MLVPPIALNIGEVVIEIVQFQVWFALGLNILFHHELGVVANVILVCYLLLVDMLYRAILVNKERFE